MLLNRSSYLFSSYKKPESMYPLNTSPLLPALSLAATFLHFVSMNLSTLGTSVKWNLTVLVFLLLAYFTQHNVLQFHLYCKNLPSFLRLNKVSSHGYTTFCLPVTIWWTTLLAILSDAAMSVISVWTCSHFPWVGSQE